MQHPSSPTSARSRSSHTHLSLFLIVLHDTLVCIMYYLITYCILIFSFVLFSFTNSPTTLGILNVLSLQSRLSRHPLFHGPLFLKCKLQVKLFNNNCIYEMTYDYKYFKWNYKYLLVELALAGHAGSHYSSSSSSGDKSIFLKWFIRLTFYVTILFIILKSLQLKNYL